MARSDGPCRGTTRGAFWGLTEIWCNRVFSLVFSKRNHRMAKPLDPSALIPAGFVVDEVVIEADRWVVRAHGAAHSSNCPACGQPSTRVHSRYRRHLSDLPSAGRCVHLEIVPRTFRCIGINSRLRILAERFNILA